MKDVAFGLFTIVIILFVFEMGFLLKVKFLKLKMDISRKSKIIITLTFWAIILFSYETIFALNSNKNQFIGMLLIFSIYFCFVSVTFRKSRYCRRKNFSTNEIKMILNTITWIVFISLLEGIFVLVFI